MADEKLVSAPTILEVNTWVWLAELSHALGRPVTLGEVPERAWDEVLSEGLDAVWLMGVWERSPAGIEIARSHPDLRGEFQRALPDLQPTDVVGSPYAVHDYQVSAHLGGIEGLASARAQLARRGISLFLDFVPNHVAVDHAWIAGRPDLLISTEGNPPRREGTFRVGGRWVAHGRDPYFPAWTDTAQVNAFSPALRQAATDTLLTVARQCDGVRCDMAMLLLNHVFEQTWGSWVGRSPATEYWTEVIAGVRDVHPDFCFVAEAYWGLEGELVDLGFDFTYDKTLYERLRRRDAPGVRQHLEASTLARNHMVHFIENHDETRAATAFAPGAARAAAIVSALIPGALLLHEGQAAGRTVKIPVQLGRRPCEPPADKLQAFYDTLIALRREPSFRTGKYQPCKRRGWPDNNTCENLVSWCRASGESRYVVVVNLADRPSQARLPLPWADLVGRDFRLIDHFQDVIYERTGNELRAPGLFVDLEPWGFHVLELLHTQ